MIGVHRPAAGEQGQVRRRRRPQLEDALVGRVLGLAFPDGLEPRVGGDRRGREVGFAGAEVDDVLAGRAAALRLLGDRDGGGGLEMLEVDRKTGSHGRTAP